MKPMSNLTKPTQFNNVFCFHDDDILRYFVVEKGVLIITTEFLFPRPQHV